MSVALLERSALAVVAAFCQCASKVAAGALVLTLNMALVPAVDGSVQDCLLHRGFAALD